MKIPLLILIGLICIGLIFLLQFGFIYLVIWLLPSIMAFWVDTDPKKTSFKIVFAGNICATLPALIPMVKISMSSFRHNEIITMATDVSSLMYSYLGAAAGWSLIFICRYFARILVTVAFEGKIKDLENEQKLLVEEWGRDITQPLGGAKSNR